jgi:hypothetical protein
MYKVLGSDGSEYGPISAEKIKQWIREGRVEQKTPVMPDGAEDWVFLGTLPEFAGCFASSEKGGISDAIKNRRWWQLTICLGLLLVALVIGALFILGKVKHH